MTATAPLFPPHDNEMAELIRRFDWTATPLGPTATWDANLRAAVSLILGSSVPMMVLWGEQGVMLYNDGYREFAGGRHPGSLGGLVCSVWPEIADFNANVLKVVRGQGQTLAYRDQHMVLMRNGAAEDVWMNLDYSPILTDQGAREGVLIIVKETTIRVRAEQRLHIAQEAGGVGTFEWYPETGLLDVSDEYRRIWGLDPDVAVTDHLLVGLLHPDDRIASGPSKLDQTNPLDYVEYRRVDPATGDIRWIARRGEVVSPHGSARRRFVGIAIDITERKHAEAQLTELAATLEQRVEAKASELIRTQEALRQSQKMESLGKLTGGVAHDFNNLLQVVSGNLQLLAKDVAGNERAERRANNALAGVSRGAKLASQLLAFGRRQALEPKVVNIGRAVSGMDDMLRRALGDEVQVETVVSGGLWNTFIDPAQIENAVLNLAINARDAMKGDGKLTIELGNAYLDDAYARAHEEVTAGQYVMLAVTDTGTGMAPEVVAQVFEPFFSTKPQGEGTGLGLSMVYGFVKQSGGHVKIYSEVGQGTTIKLYLPRVDQSEDVVVALDTGPIVGGPETILVAEDDEEVRATVVEMLSELGYRVLKAKDAASALTIIESGLPIDLLFTDVVMPGTLRSPELARMARERLPDIAVLFTSGYTENAIVHGGRLDAGVELLGKPYTREAMARKIRHVLANRAQRQVLAPTPRPNAPPAGATPTARLTVLLVEDDALIRGVTGEFLQDLGHVVIEAANAEDATAALETAPIDVLVTDLGLPGLSGSAFADQARALRPRIGIVFATGDDHAPDLAGAGSAAYLLRKPYDSLGLAAALRAVAPDPAAADASASSAESVAQS
jgi:PAS domain S-box-containing protein